MDKIEKLLRKISEKDRKRLLQVIEKLISNQKGLDIKKIKDSDLHTLRSGRFRIVFHYQGTAKIIVIDSIKLRNERTYKV